MTVINGVASTGGVSSTILKALTDIQTVPAATGATTVTVGGTYYEPAGQARLTSNAVYKRYIAVKVSAQSNTAGTISVVLRNVTAGTSGTPVTVVIAGGQENVEKTIAATVVTVTATNLGDVFTILVTHTILGSTVTLNSGGIMEADGIQVITGTGRLSQIVGDLLNANIVGTYLSSLKIYLAANSGIFLLNSSSVNLIISLNSFSCSSVAIGSLS